MEGCREAGSDLKPKKSYELISIFYSGPKQINYTRAYVAIAVVRCSEFVDYGSNAQLYYLRLQR